jgi:hypothetical protein
MLVPSYDAGRIYSRCFLQLRFGIGMAFGNELMRSHAFDCTFDASHMRPVPILVPQLTLIVC